MRNCSYELLSIARSLYTTVHVIMSYPSIFHIQEKQSRSSSRPATATLSNSLCPFNTVMKPTCGYYFSRGTDNRKKRIGIPPSDLVAWRPLFSAKTPRAKTA